MTKRRVISDPGEIAALVLRTPGLADKLADACARLSGDDPAPIRAVVHKTLVDMAEAWSARR